MSQTFKVTFDSDKPLSEKAFQVVTLAASGMSEAEIGEKMGMSRRQVYRYTRDPQVKQAIREARNTIWEQTCNILVTESVEAAKTLANVMRDQEGNMNRFQMMAASKLLDITTKVRSSEELERRLEMLEAVLLERGTADGDID